MASQASSIFIDITIDIDVCFFCLRVDVTVGATELGVIVWVGVAIKALVPFTVMYPRIDREILAVVIEIRRSPFYFRMAAFTVR